ncbi:MAG: hypothetical protein MJZ76_07580 [Bacteroidales bacterium]|nr:hypothetical protein [Bacteroidales bacterium]
MKKIIFALVSLLAVCLCANAQNENQKPQQPAEMVSPNSDEECKVVCSMRRTYMQDSLQLTEKESKAFWALYDETEVREHEIYKKFHTYQKESGIKSAKGRVDMKQMDPTQALAFMEKKIDFKTELQKLESDFFKDLKKILPAEKVVRYYELEKGFKREMVRKMKSEKTPHKKPR